MQIKPARAGLGRFFMDIINFCEPTPTGIDYNNC